MSDCSTMSVCDLADSDHDSLKENRPYQKKVKSCNLYLVLPYVLNVGVQLLYQQLWVN